jgi:hypothetical protein
MHKFVATIQVLIDAPAEYEAAETLHNLVKEAHPWHLVTVYRIHPETGKVNSFEGTLFSTAQGDFFD